MEGRPVARAEVELLALPGNFEWAHGILTEHRTLPSPSAHGMTGEAGRFELEAPGAGVYTVLVRAAGFIPMRYFPLAVVGAVDLPAAPLHHDAGARVTLRNPSGGSAAGIWVMAVPSDRSFWQAAGEDGWRVAARIGRSDDLGRWTLPRAPDERLEIFAFPADRPHARGRGVGQDATVVLGAPPAPREILIHDGSGAPLAGVAVSSGTLAWPAGITDESGRLSLVDPEPGPGWLHLFASDGRRVSARLALEAGDEVLRILLPEAFALEGRILDARTREPVAGALVWTGHDPGKFTVSDGRGSYRLPVPAAERFWIQAEAPGYLPRQQWLEPAREAAAFPAATLALEPAVAILGSVVDADRRPLADVDLEVEIVPVEARSPAFRLAATDGRARSGSGGGFRIDGLQPGNHYRLQAVKPGYGRGHLLFDAASEVAEDSAIESPAGIVVTLTAARPAFGRVLDGGERPVAGAEVTVFSSPGDDPGGGARRHARVGAVRAITDARGRFELAALPGAVVDLEAAGEGFTPLRVRRVEIPAGQEPVDLGTLILIAGETLGGVVIDLEGGPVAEASVWITEDVGQARLADSLIRQQDPAATTDPRGRFRIPDLEPHRRLHLLVERPGFLPATLLGVEIPHDEPLLVRLERASEVRGRVVDVAGAGIAGARVTVRERELPEGIVEVQRGPQRAVSTTSEADGSFVLAGVEPGEAAIEATAAGYQPSAAIEIEIPAEGVTEDVLVELELGAVLAGRVTDGRERPVAGARVLLERQAGRTDAEGRYRIDGVASGPQTIEVRHRGYERAERELDVQQGSNLADFVLSGGWSVSGKVVGPAGEAVAGARLRLSRRGRGAPRNYQVGSGATGGFRFPEVVAGRYDVEAEKAGFVTALREDAFEVTADDVADVEIELRHGAELRGRVLGLSFEELAVVKVRAELGGRTLEGTADFEGDYRISDLGPGDWLVTAWLAGGSRETRGRVTVEPGVRELRQDLRFGEGVTLAGRILYGGDPLAGAQVTAMSSMRVVRRSVVSDHRGSFRIEDLEPGSYRLGLSHARELLTHYEDVDVAADRAVVIEIGTARVRGRVRSASTLEPVDGALVVFQKLLGPDAADPGPILTVGTSPQGEFAVGRVSPGRHRLTVEKSGYSRFEQPVEITQGEELDLALELEASAGLELSLRLASGLRPEYAVAHVYDDSGRWIVSDAAFLDAAGVARFEAVPAGTWDLLLSAPGGAAVRRRITTPGGPPTGVVLPTATRVEVRVPALVASNGLATLRIEDPQGRPFTAVDPATGLPRERFQLMAGVGAVESVPPGIWTLRVEAADGQQWLDTVVASGEPRIEGLLE